MWIKRGYKYKLVLTKEQAELFKQWAGACRYVYNLGLEHRKKNWEWFGKSETFSSQCKQLTQLKKEKEVEWLNEVPSQCLQQSLRNLDQAFQNFFSGKAKYPKFRKKGDGDSFRFPDPKQFSVWNTKKKGIADIPKIGEVKFICSRENAYEGRICNLTISRDGEDWSISIQCEVEIQAFEVIPEEDIGLDSGVIHALTGSNGEYFDLPIEQLKRIEKQISLLQKKLAVQKKFGKNWEKTRKRIAKLYRRIRRIKEDFIQKMTTRIVNGYGAVFVEDLRIKNMTASASGTVEEPGKNVAQKSGLNRAILRASLGRISDVLEYKCDWKGRLFRKVDPRNSSNECAKCHNVDSKSRKSQAEFECTFCKYKQNADINAAQVIQSRAYGSAPREPGKLPEEKAA